MERFPNPYERDPTRHEQVKCPDCNGTGVKGGKRTVYDIGKDVKCPRCKGTGIKPMRG